MKYEFTQNAKIKSYTKCLVWNAYNVHAFTPGTIALISLVSLIHIRYDSKFCMEKSNAESGVYNCLLPHTSAICISWTVELKHKSWHTLMLENLHTRTLGIALILDAKKDGFATFLRKVKHTKSLNSERANFRYELSATEAQNKQQLLC